MNNNEIITVAILGILNLICLISHIVLFFKGQKIAKIIFCLYAALCLLSSVAFMVLNLFIILPISAFINRIAMILVLSLNVFSCSEFTSMIHLLNKTRKDEVEKSVKEYKPLSDQTVLPNNVRKKGQIIHNNYKIIK